MILNEERLNYHITNIHLWPTCHNMRYYFQVYPRIMVLVVPDNLKRKKSGYFMMILCTLYNFFTVFTSFFVSGLVLKQFDNACLFFFFSFPFFKSGDSKIIRTIFCFQKFSNIRSLYAREKYHFGEKFPFSHFDLCFRLTALVET